MTKIRSRKVILTTIFLSLAVVAILAQVYLPTDPRKNSPSSNLVPSVSPPLTPISSKLPSPTPPESPNPPISGGNQLLNPCFDGPHNGDPLNWTEAAPGGWDVSANKNPCGVNATAARLNDPSFAGQSQPNVHEYLSQVVPGHGPNITVQMACIQHFALIGDTNIYGGPAPNGPWDLVWRPFTLADCAISTVDDRGWKPVREAQATLSKAYPYYKIEFHGMRDADGGGLKITSAYFNSQ